MGLSGIITSPRHLGKFVIFCQIFYSTYKDVSPYSVARNIPRSLDTTACTTTPYNTSVTIAAMATAPIATVSNPFRLYANINATVMHASEGISPPAEVNTAGNVMAASTP